MVYKSKLHRDSETFVYDEGKTITDEKADEILKILGKMHKQLYAAKSEYTFIHKGDPENYEKELEKRLDNHTWTESKEKELFESLKK